MPIINIRLPHTMHLLKKLNYTSLIRYRTAGNLLASQAFDLAVFSELSYRAVILMTSHHHFISSKSSAVVANVHQLTQVVLTPAI